MNSEKTKKRGILRRLAARVAVAAMVIGLMAGYALPAEAAPGNLYARGMTNPEGGAFMGTHYWVSDESGFCRLDAAAGGTFAINPATCALIGPNQSPGMPAYDAVRNLVYVPDKAPGSSGIWRLTFNPATQTVGNPVRLAPAFNLGRFQPKAVALGPDGRLYFGSAVQAALRRINNPAGAAGTQNVAIIGRSSDRRDIEGLAFAGRDLYVAQKSAITIIRNATGAAVPSKVAQATTIVAPEPDAITSDRSNVLYISDTNAAGRSTILRYTISTNTQVVYSRQGRLPNGTLVAFRFAEGLTLDPQGNLFIGDDPTNGGQNGRGRIWRIPAGAAPGSASAALEE